MTTSPDFETSTSTSTNEHEHEHEHERARRADAAPRSARRAGEQAALARFASIDDHARPPCRPSSARLHFATTFPKWLRKDDFVFEGGRISNAAHVTSLASVQAIVTKFDAHHMQEQNSRSAASVDADPALAIGSAKELIDTCCGTILAERGKPATGKEDVLELVRAARVELKLVPDDATNAAKGARPSSGS